MVCCELPLSPPAAKRLLSMVLLVGVIFQASLGIIAFIVLNVCLLLWIVGSLVYYQYYAKAATSSPSPPPNRSSSSRVEKNIEDNNIEHGKEVEIPASRPPRILYLDNLKTFLTVIVVLHHAVIQFGGQPGNWVIQIGLYKNSFQPFISSFTLLNQSYFMCLFFFISAYFVPTSVDKRGTVIFLKERFKRLGIPFVATMLVLWPLLDVAVHFFIGNGDDYSYIPIPGPLWFAGWLLIFSYAYTLCGGPVLVMTCPSLGVMIATGLVLGLVQAILMLILPFGFLFMPISFGSLPFDICFFMAGIVCRRNKWLDETDSRNVSLINTDAAEEQPVGNSSPQGSLLRFIEAHRTFLYITTVLIAIIFCVTVAVFQITDLEQPFVQTNPGDDDGQDDDQDDPNPSPDGPLLRTIVTVLIMALLSGVFTFTMSLCALDFFRKYFSFTSERSSYLAGASYAVYIIHPWVITPVLFVWIKIIENFSGDEIYFINGGVVSYTDVGKDAYLWCGFLVVSIISVPMCWVLGGALKKLPGLRNIL